MLPAVPRRRLRAFADTLLAAVLLSLGQWQVWGGWHDGGVGVPPHDDRVARALLAVLITAPLVWRRRWPLSVAAVVCAAIVCQLVTVVAYVPFLAGLVPMAIANYTTAAYARRWRPAGLVFVLATEAVIYVRIPEERASGEVLFSLFVALGTWIVGDVVRSRSHRAQQALGDARVLVAQSQAATAAALAEERGRIARELHDVIAHSVSVMGVQAGAARMLMGQDPEAARDALLEVETAARSSVAELQRLLAVLRDGDNATAQLVPQPGLGQLADLVAQMRAAGLDVTVTYDEGVRLPPGLDLTAFRIIQEALTNALKHAGTATHLAVENHNGRLTIEVTNAGPAVARRGAAGTQHGLIGMRERVQLYGGTLHTRLEPGGGFTVRAELPLDLDPALDRVP